MASGLTDAEVFGTPAPAPQSASAGMTDAQVFGVQPPPMKPPSMAADVGLSYLSRLRDTVANGVDTMANVFPGVGSIDRMLTTGSVRQAVAPDPLHVVGAIAQRLAQNHGGGAYQPQTVPGQVAANAAPYTFAALAPGSIPARAANVVIPALASEAAGQVAQRLHAPPMVEQIARTGAGLVGGAAASTRINPAGVKRPDVLPLVTEARKAAYGRVEAAGDVIPQSALKGLADDVTAMVKAKAGPDGKAAYPGAFSVASRIRAMAAAKKGVTLPELDTLRSDLHDAMIASGDRESKLGIGIRQKIDQLISDTGNPDIRAARDLNTREHKIGEIQAEVRSAQLRAAGSNSGQNVNNNIRQELRPLIDPTRNQRITNLSPEELQAMEHVVEGSPGQNAMRDASNILRNRYLQGALAVPTLGTVPATMEVLGRVLNHLGKNATMDNVEKAIALIASGGSNRVAPPIAVPQRPPLVSIGPHAGVAPVLAGAMLMSSGPASSAPARRKPARR